MLGRRRGGKTETFYKGKYFYGNLFHIKLVSLIYKALLETHKSFKFSTCSLTNSCYCRSLWLDLLAFMACTLILTSKVRFNTVVTSITIVHIQKISFVNSGCNSALVCTKYFNIFQEICLQ